MNELLLQITFEIMCGKWGTHYPNKYTIIIFIK